VLQVIGWQSDLRAEDPAEYGLPSVEEQPIGDKRAGVIWHTQGSGKSLSMVFYTGKLVLAEAMNNPPSWCSPTATTSTSNSSRPSAIARACSAKRPSKPPTATS
jgi:hypothetical protein